MKLSTIEKIHSIKPHLNADTLERGKIMGWNVVVPKGQYRDGELVVFIHPDTVVDPSRPEFAFLESKKWRVNSIRLRGELSCGLVMPLSILPQGIAIAEGSDVSGALGVTHYEKPMPTNLDAIGNFPSYLVSITDEDNLKSNLGAHDELLRAGPCYIGIKLDGISCSVIDTREGVKVCSRRLELKEGNTPYWNVSKKYGIIEKLRGKNCAVQFEVVGPGIHGNHMGLRELEIGVFDVKDFNRGEYLGYQDLKDFCASFHLPMVPVLRAEAHVPSFDELVEMADNAKYPNGSRAEGVVVRPCNPIFSETLGKNLSVKIINANYKE